MQGPAMLFANKEDVSEWGASQLLFVQMFDFHLCSDNDGREAGQKRDYHLQNWATLSSLFSSLN